MNQSFPTQRAREKSRENFSNFPHSPLQRLMGQVRKDRAHDSIHFREVQNFAEPRNFTHRCRERPRAALEFELFFGLWKVKFLLIFNNLHAKFDASAHLNCTAIYWRNFPFTALNCLSLYFNLHFICDEVKVAPSTSILLIW